jgi:murein L,D-transpeptidase YcbB/YkuD
MQPERRKTSLFCSLAIGVLAPSLFVLPAHAQGDLGSAPAIAAPVTAWREADVAALRNALAGASAHGLDASELRKALRTTSPEDAARMDRIALTYARALAFGVVDPKRLHETFSLEVNQRALEGELNAALRQGRLRAWLASLAPQGEEYRALSAAYLAARAGPKTDAARARTLALNLERLRWLDRHPDATRIDVNVAAAKLWFFKDGALLDSRKVVVGAPGHETPLLQASFRRIVVNPPWNVPAKIARKEILVKGSGYMERHNMRRVDGRVVQDPGPDNSLGQVKFDLQDDQDIYLHDTPVQSAFERADRHLSHGCVRVEDAVGFARLVAEQFGAADRFEDRLATGETGTVSLGAEVPVRMLYLTAYADEGDVRIVKDRYGWDAKLAQALGLADGGPGAVRLHIDN